MSGIPPQWPSPTGPLSPEEEKACITVARAMLKGMKQTKLPWYAQKRAAIQALIVVGGMDER